MAIKHSWLSSSLIIGALLSASLNALAEQLTLTTYLANGAPSFTQTIQQFEENYNDIYPNYMIPLYQEITQLNKDNLAYFASKINDTLYSSMVIDAQTKRIKSLQLTYIAPLSIPTGTATVAQPETGLAMIINGNRAVIKSSEDTAHDYMAALLAWFNPPLTHEDGKKEWDRLLKIGRDEPLYQEITDNLRYVVVDRGEKGITLAVEPIKQKVAARE